MSKIIKCRIFILWNLFRLWQEAYSDKYYSTHELCEHYAKYEINHSEREKHRMISVICDARGTQIHREKAQWGFPEEGVMGSCLAGNR